MTEGVGSRRLKPGKRKSADHWTLWGRVAFWTLQCLQKNGADKKGCKGEGLRDR